MALTGFFIEQFIVIAFWILLLCLYFFFFFGLLSEYFFEIVVLIVERLSVLVFNVDYFGFTVVDAVEGVESFAFFWGVFVLVEDTPIAEVDRLDLLDLERLANEIAVALVELDELLVSNLAMHAAEDWLVDFAWLLLVFLVDGKADTVQLIVAVVVIFARIE